MSSTSNAQDKGVSGFIDFVASLAPYNLSASCSGHCSPIIYRANGAQSHSHQDLQQCSGNLVVLHNFYYCRRGFVPTSVR